MESYSPVYAMEDRVDVYDTTPTSFFEMILAYPEEAIFSSRPDLSSVLTSRSPQVIAVCNS